MSPHTEHGAWPSPDSQSVNTWRMREETGKGSEHLASGHSPFLTPVFLSPPPLPTPPQLAYCVVQFLEKDATLTEHVSTSGGEWQAAPLQV